MTPESDGRRPATQDELMKVKSWHGISSSDDVQIDDDAKVSEVDAGLWVQGWLWLPNEAR